MTELANEPRSAAEPAPVVSAMLPKAAQQWLGYVSPAFQRFTGAVESRLGFCPLKLLAKGASEQLDVLAGGLQRIASLLRAAAGVQAEAQPNGPESPAAQA